MSATKFSIIKKCLEAMTADQQDHLIEHCVNLVMMRIPAIAEQKAGNGQPIDANPKKRFLEPVSSNTIRIDRPKGSTAKKVAAKQVEAKQKKVGKRGSAIKLEVAGKKYDSLAKFCQINNLAASTLYHKISQAKTPGAKQKVLESALKAKKG